MPVLPGVLRTREKNDRSVCCGAAYYIVMIQADSQPCARLQLVSDPVIFDDLVLRIASCICTLRRA